MRLLFVCLCLHLGVIAKMAQTPQQLAQTDIAAGWPLPDVAQAVAVELSEGGGNTASPNIVGWDNNGVTVADTTGNPAPPPAVPYTSYDTGDFQINSSSNPSHSAGTYDPNWISSMEDPNQNAKQALGMFNSRGWSPWTSDAAISSGANQQAGLTALKQADPSYKGPSIFASSVGTGAINPITGASASGSTSTGSSGSTTPKRETQQLTGLAGVLQQLDGLLNPTTSSFTLLKGVPFLQTTISNPESSITSLLELIAVRGFLAVGFGFLTYLGVKSLTGTGGGTVVNILEKQQGRRISRENVAAGQANRESTQQHQINLENQKAANRIKTAQKQEAAKRATFRARGY